MIFKNYAQAVAHFLHASAQALQLAWCEACLLHSSAQAVHAFTHKAHNSLVYCDPLASNLAHNAQISAQSQHNKIQAWLPSLIQSVIQLSQVITHAKHASIQFFESLILLNLICNRIITLQR